MTRATLDITMLVVLSAGIVGLLLKLFWPSTAHEPGEADNWAQHNEQRTPSLENSAEARDNSIDVAVFSQIVGD